MIRSRLLRPALAVSIAFLAGCSNPALTANLIAGVATAAQGFLITDADEIKIGQETKAKVLSTMPQHPNPALRDYVTKIGQKMVAQSDRKGIAYEFYAVESNDINAFAAPGGFVFVTTGALRLMTNEAQLAGVLGHEVGHVVKRHSIEGIRNTMALQGVSIAVLGKDGDKFIQAATNIAANLILKGFDRGQELQSDSLGAEYTYKAGYDPRELGTFLDALRKTSGEQPAWLTAVSDHPKTDDRLTKLDEFVKAEKMDLTKVVKGEAEFRTGALDVLGVAPTAPTSTGTTPTAGPTPDASGSYLPPGSGDDEE